MAAVKIYCSGPAAELSDAYYLARFKILREPLGFAPSAAILPDDCDAIHAWAEVFSSAEIRRKSEFEIDIHNSHEKASERPRACASTRGRGRGLNQGVMREGSVPESDESQLDDNSTQIVAVGRIHLIPEDSCGACADSVDENAAYCPDFTPLSESGILDENGLNLPNPKTLRPAVQVRQMGTLPEHQRCGHAAAVLAKLEAAAVNQWGNCAGFLQARVGAIPFYKSQGWTSFQDDYIVQGIGLHRSMWKPLTGKIPTSTGAKDC